MRGMTARNCAELPDRSRIREDAIAPRGSSAVPSAPQSCRAASRVVVASASSAAASMRRKSNSASLGCSFNSCSVTWSVPSRSERRKKEVRASEAKSALRDFVARGRSWPKAKQSDARTTIAAIRTRTPDLILTCEPNFNVAAEGLLHFRAELAETGVFRSRDAETAELHRGVHHEFPAAA